jgi:hypothetical protein
MLLHIAHGDEWVRAQEDGLYWTSSLHDQGYIHCSYPHQVIEVANSIYRGSGAWFSSTSTQIGWTHGWSRRMAAAVSCTPTSMDPSTWAPS